jgi:CheY-like chemotaxis protein
MVADPGALALMPAVPVRGNETVLVVEDDLAVRQFVLRVLAEWGYTALAANSPAQALDLVRQHAEQPIHLLLTDVILPGLSGRDLAAEVATLLPHIRVLYISGYADTTIAHQGLLAPDVAFLEKPFTPAALAHKIRAVLSAP